MSLIINNIESSSSTINHKYLTERESFGLSFVGTYTVNISDIEFEDDDIGLIAGVEALKKVFSEPSVVGRIGGDDFTNGTLTSLTFDQSTLAGSLKATLVIKEDKNLSEYKPSDPYDPQGAAVDIPQPHLLESFSETYSFDRSGGEYNYDRSLSIKYIKGSDSFLSNIKLFLSDYFSNNRPDLGYQTDGISENARFNQGFKGNLSEEIDLINLSVSLTESFNSNTIHTGGVGRSKKYSIAVNEKGYIDKTYEINLNCLSSNNNSVLQLAVKQELDDLITEQAGDSPISTEKGFSVDGRAATLTATFSNNPESNNESKVFSCSKEFSEKETTYSLSVTYKAEADATFTEWENTNQLYENDTTTPLQYVQRLFLEAEDVYEKSKTVNSTKNKPASITEQTVFSDSDAFDTEDLDGALKYQLSTSSDNIKKVESEAISQIGYDLIGKKEFYISNENKKITSVTSSLDVSLVQGTAGEAMTFMEDSGRATDLLSGASGISAGVTDFYLQSDTIVINLDANTATRTHEYKAI
jgi:hypothetical protein